MRKNNYNNNRNQYLNKDSMYNCPIISKMINIIMKDGKKTIAEKIMYKCLYDIRVKYSVNPYKVLMECIDNIYIDIDIRKKKIGGSTYNIPYKLSNNKGYCRAIHSLINVCRKKKGKLYNNLSNEIYNTCLGVSDCINVCIDYYKRIEVNQSVTIS